MKKWILLVSCLSLVFFFLYSCIITVVDRERLEGRSVNEFQRSIAFRSGGTISLININGDIEIQGWDKEEVNISAEKIMPLPLNRKVRVYPLRYTIPKIDIEQSENHISIKTSQVEREREPDTVHYYLNVPQSVNLEEITTREGDIAISDLYGDVSVKLREGNLKVDNFSGTLTASVNIGNVTASLYDLRAEDEITITSREGDITVSFQPDMKARIKTSAPNGTISNAFDTDEPLPGNKLSAEIGEEGTFVYLKALNGDIKIKKILPR